MEVIPDMSDSAEKEERKGRVSNTFPGGSVLPLPEPNFLQVLSK